MAGTPSTPVVWIIDDCPLSTRIVRARLKSFADTLIEFPTGGAAVAEWIAGSQPKPACILLDLNMPVHTGLDTARLLRDAGYTGGMLLHTAATNVAQTVGLEMAGIDGVVLKPATSRSLRLAVEDAIAAHRRSA